MDYDHALEMAKRMKEQDPEILAAIKQVQAAKHGVVALRFSHGGREMAVEVLDEPYQGDVRVYPGEE